MKRQRLHLQKPKGQDGETLKMIRWWEAVPRWNKDAAWEVDRAMIEWLLGWREKGRELMGKGDGKA